MLAISMLLAGHALLTRPAGMSELAAHRRASTSIAETAALYAGDEHAAKLAVAERWAAGFARLIADERLAPAADSRWQREPFVSRALAPLAVGFFTATHLAAAVERNFLDAGLGSFDARGRAGWQVGRVGTPRGHSFEEAKMLWSEVEEALARGTVVFNSFGAHEPALAELCLGAVHAFGLPANLNLYITKVTITPVTTRSRPSRRGDARDARDVATWRCGDAARGRGGDEEVDGRTDGR
jgi:hypothetical protein